MGDEAPMNRMLVLDIIRQAIPVLAANERELLPTAHLIWFGTVSD